jgi:hypothetical protein
MRTGVPTRPADAGDVGHAVGQGEQDQHEAEGALAEGLDDLADGDRFALGLVNHGPQDDGGTVVLVRPVKLALLAIDAFLRTGRLCIEVHRSPP